MNCSLSGIFSDTHIECRCTRRANSHSKFYLDTKLNKHSDMECKSFQTMLVLSSVCDNCSCVMKLSVNWSRNTLHILLSIETSFRHILRDWLRTSFWNTCDSSLGQATREYKKIKEKITCWHENAWIKFRFLIREIAWNNIAGRPNGAWIKICLDGRRAWN